jgi:hypothetical protein
VSERRPTDARLERALRALGPELAYPETPPLVPAVTTRLTAERAGRPTTLGRPLLRDRRVLVLAAVAALALLAIAAAARFVLGAAEIRVRPTPSPTVVAPPFAPEALGEPLPLGELEAAAGSPIGLPAGPPPDAAYLFEGPSGSDGALLAWAASERYPAIPGTPWGLVLVQVEGDGTAILKTTGNVEDVRIVRIDGRRAFWLEEPHALDVRTTAGYERFSVEGNVLIWAEGGITYRLETSLGLAEAQELAGSLRFRPGTRRGPPV